MSRLQIRVQEGLRAHVEEQAARLGLTISEYVVGAIAERLRRDAEAASRIELPSESRDWFFKVLEDRSPLPEKWGRASELAEEIEG